MLEIIRNRWKQIALMIVLLAGAAFLPACATQPKQVALVSDPDSQTNSAIPWNKPASWEGRGDLPPGLGEQTESPHGSGTTTH